MSPSRKMDPLTVPRAPTAFLKAHDEAQPRIDSLRPGEALAILRPSLVEPFFSFVRFS